jgi:hypothetical protein
MSSHTTTWTKVELAAFQKHHQQGATLSQMREIFNRHSYMQIRTQAKKLKDDEDYVFVSADDVM